MIDKTKKYLEFIKELKSSTYFDAATEVRFSQPRLADKFDRMGEEANKRVLRNDKEKAYREYMNLEFQIKLQSELKEKTIKNFELKILNSYEFDYYFENVNIDYEEKIDDVFKVKFLDYESHYDVFWFYHYSTELESEVIRKYNGDANNILSSYVISKKNISDSQFYGNKFANRKSAVKFIQMCHKLYKIHDKNMIVRALGKINNTKLSKVKDGSFKRFIDNNFGSWEEFRKKVNLREMYDNYK